VGLAWALAAALASVAAAAAGSGLLLALGPRAERAAAALLPFAAGTLLGASLLLLLPEALERGAPGRACALFLGGAVAFLAVERLVRERAPHAHRAGEAHRPEVERATAAMVLWGDALHNLLDGVVIGASFRADPGLGAAAALAVFAHEVPQELGDFAILLGAGLAPRRAFALNLASASTVVVGAAAGWGASAAAVGALPWLLPVAAGGFAYIALADLAPALHRRRFRGAAALDLALLAAGIALVGWLGRHG
jgi:zinc and cadmium transporter